MEQTAATAPYERIWDIETGDRLIARSTMHLEEDPAAVVLFTEGKAYRVVRCHPLRRVPSVIVVCDDGSESHVEPDFLANFRHARGAA